jgi:hypothetical protein
MTTPRSLYTHASESMRDLFWAAVMVSPFAAYAVWFVVEIIWRMI